MINHLKTVPAAVGAAASSTEPAPKARFGGGNQSPRGKRRFKRWLPYLLAAGIAAVLYFTLRPQPLLVEIGTVARGPLSVSISEEGKTRVKERYIVSAPVGGQLRRVTLEAGDPIARDETVLAEIEPGMSTFLDPRARVQAEAAVRSAEAGRARSAADVERVRRSLEFARSNWERIRKLSQQGGVSIEARDTAEREFAVLSQEMLAAESGLKMAESDVEQRRAALLEVGATREDTGDSAAIVKVLAPVDGAVLRVLQESSATVLPGTPLMEVGAPRDLEIEVDVLSRDAVAIRPGAEVLLEEWGGDRPLAARVRLVEPSAYTKISALGVEEQRTNVIIDFAEPLTDNIALSDLFRVDARIFLWRRDDVVLIPAGALFRRGGKWTAFVIENGRAQRREVQVDHSDGVLTEVVSGIKPGAKVVLHPSDKVADGVAVRPRD